MPMFNMTRTMTSGGPQKIAHTSWPIEQCIYCVQRHQKHGSFIKQLREEFLTKFETEKSPSFSVVQRWIKNFNTYGSVRNQNSASNYKSSHSGHPRKREVIEDASKSVLDCLNCSLRNCAQSLGLKPTTCWRAMRIDLKLFPYRIQTLQILSESDKLKRTPMEMKIIEKTSRSLSFLGAA